ncbi:hypothetical protein GCM10009804_41880 [Kribbella hippodromi]|uniref:Uncharacterized protein n=1 Tax=Kribbella hippodromi TaxID=434347 RepID=A0ABP4PGZ0_9ACTN
MRTVPFVLGLLVALVISAQILMLMQRRRPAAKRLRDLGTGGDAYALLFAGMLTATATGAVAGSLLDAPGSGAAAGLVLAVLTWTAAVLWTHRRPSTRRHQPPKR